MDYVVSANWSCVAILYQENIGAVVQLQDMLSTAGIEIISRQVLSANFQPVLTDIKRHNVFNMLLDIEPGHLHSFFRECR